jgi:hypothetical protein
MTARHKELFASEMLQRLLTVGFHTRKLTPNAREVLTEAMQLFIDSIDAASVIADQAGELGFIVPCDVCGGRALLRTPRLAYTCPLCAEVAEPKVTSAVEIPHGMLPADDYPIGSVEG